MLSRPGGGAWGRAPEGLRAPDEDGAFAVIWVLAVVAILLFAALAIDLGNITQTKQHAQDAADNAATSAAVDLAPIASGSSAPSQEAMAVADAESYVNQNYSSIGTNWASNACPNALPPGVSASAQTNCIGFFNPLDASKNLSDPTGIAVTIPGQSVRYSFGRVGGLTSQGVSALAEASVQNPGAGFLLPFGFATGGASGLQCLKTGSGNKAGACTGFAVGSGLFGVLNSPRYRVLPGSANSGGQNPFIMTDIDLGIDHQLNDNALPPTNAPEVCDATGTPPNCPAYNATAPYDNANYVAPQPGQTLNDPGPALFNADQNSFTVDGCTIRTPRFFHPPGFQANGDCTQVNPTAGSAGPLLSAADSFGSGLGLNGEHITNYLVGGMTNSLFTLCYSGKGPGGTTPNPASQAIDAQVGGTNVWTGSATTEDGCLSSAIAGMTTSSPPIFSIAIARSPRFGIVPVIVPGNGRDAQEITGFLGVFLDMASGTGTKVDSIAAWVFPLNLVQGGSAGSGGGLGGYSGGPFVVNLCSLPAGNC